MRQTVYVAELHGHQALLVSERASSCGGCAGQSSCSTLGSWKEASGKGRMLSLLVDNTLHAQEGDAVVIEVADDLLLKTAFRLYAIPMLYFIVVGGAVWLGTHSDVAASCSGIVSVVLYYLHLWRQGTPKDFDVRMVSVQ